MKKTNIKSKFIYTSNCCNQPAHKPPVSRSPEDFKENKFSQCGLGKWRCGQCEKLCKVKRSKVQEDNGTDSRTT